MRCAFPVTSIYFFAIVRLSIWICRKQRVILRLPDTSWNYLGIAVRAEAGTVNKKVNERKRKDCYEESSDFRFGRNLVRFHKEY